VVTSASNGTGEAAASVSDDPPGTAKVARLPLFDGTSTETDALTAVIRRLSAAHSLSEVMAVTTQAARALVNADGITFVLRDGDLCYYADEDSIGPLWKGKRFPIGACISGWVIQNGKSVRIADIEQDERIPQDAYRQTFVKSLAMVPIRQEEPIGAMGAYWASTHSASREEMERLQTIANAASLAVAFVERCETEAAFRDKAAMLDALLEYVPEGITIARAPDVTIERVSSAGLKRIQRAEEDVTGIGAEQHPETWQVFDQAGERQLSSDELPLTRAVKQAETIENERLNLRLPNGSLLPILCSAGPIRNAADNVTGGIIAWRDISDLEKLEEERQLLVEELNHRVKNLFAVVGAMVGLTAGKSTTVQEMSEALTGRITALASAHDLIRPGTERPTGSEEIGLEDLLERLLAPHLDWGAQQCRVTGPKVAIGVVAATRLALVIHELATNAAKYGALSTPSGSLCIAWREVDESLVLDWEEAGGPNQDKTPEQPGFGSKLIDVTMTRQLGGAINYDWGASGLRLRLSVPLASLQE
jgi:two-component sensor histidine kinase